MTRRRIPPILVAALAASLACRRGDPLSASDSSFVAAMVELRRVPAGPAGTEAARHAILRRRRLTVDSLERYARRLATNPEHAAAVWREIDKVPLTAPLSPAATPAVDPASVPRSREALRNIRGRVQ